MPEMRMIAITNEDEILHVTLSRSVQSDLQTEIESQYLKFTTYQNRNCLPKNFRAHADIKLQADETFFIDQISQSAAPAPFNILNKVYVTPKQLNSLPTLDSSSYLHLKFLGYIFYIDGQIEKICLQDLNKQHILQHRWNLLLDSSVNDGFERFQHSLLLLPSKLTAYLTKDVNSYTIYFKSYFALRNMIHSMDFFYRIAQDQELQDFEHNYHFIVPAGHSLSELAHSQRLKRKIAQILDTEHLQNLTDHTDIHSAIQVVLPTIQLRNNWIEIPTNAKDFETFLYALSDQCNKSLFSQDIILYEGGHPILQTP